MRICWKCVKKLKPLICVFVTFSYSRCLCSRAKKPSHPLFSSRIENIMVDTHSEKEKGIFVSVWSGDQVWLLASPALNTPHKLSDMPLTNCIIRPWQLNVCLPDGESPLWWLVFSGVLVFSLFQLSHGGFTSTETQHLTWDGSNPTSWGGVVLLMLSCMSASIHLFINEMKCGN